MCAYLLQVVEETISDDDVLMIRGCQATTASTVLLRGANDFMLDEMDRSLHDAFCIVKRVLESGTVVPGEANPSGISASSDLLQAVPHLDLCAESSSTPVLLDRRRGSGGSAVELP